MGLAGGGSLLGSLPRWLIGSRRGGQRKPRKRRQRRGAQTQPSRNPFPTMLLRILATTGALAVARGDDGHGYADDKVTPSSSAQLAALQEQLQQALDQQATLSDQQAALTDAMQPLLNWANIIAPHDTGCDLDHYTSIISLCGAEASTAEADSVPDADMTAASRTDTGCDCMDTWYFDGGRYHGCQITNQPPKSHFHHSPWCVVGSGCTGAHPGPWGAWDYCKVSTNWTNNEWGVDEKNRNDYFSQKSFGGHAPVDPWLMEPQALFLSTHYHSVSDPMELYCSDDTCNLMLNKLVGGCKDTEDTVMQEVVGLVGSDRLKCDNVTRAPPPPPPGARTYEITVMLHASADMNTQAVMQVVMTLLSCEEKDIQDFKPTGVAGTYSFTLVTYSLHKATIQTDLSPIGDVDITTIYGYDMTDEGPADGDIEDKDGPDPAVLNPNTDYNSLLIMFAFSTIGTLAALSFCGVVGKVRKFARPDSEEYEMYGESMMKYQRYAQPLSPLGTPEDAHQQGTQQWMPQYAGHHGSEDGGWEQHGSEPVMSWDSPSRYLTESDDGSGTPEHEDGFDDADPFGLGGEKMVDAHDPGSMSHSWVGSGDGTSLGDDVAAVMDTAGGSHNYTTDSDHDQSDMDGYSSSNAGTPETMAVAHPVDSKEAQYTAAPVVMAEADRVAMLERQLADAQGQLRDSLRRQDEIVRMKSGMDGAAGGYKPPGQVKVEVYYDGGAAAAQPQPQHAGMRRPPVSSHPAPMTWLGNASESQGGASGLQVVGPRFERGAAPSAPEPNQPPPAGAISVKVEQGPVSGKRPAPATSEDGTAQRPFTCKFPGCTYAASQRRYMSEHERVHSGARPYRCPWEGCNYASSGSGHMSRHVRVHTGDRPYKCDEPGCGYEASQSGHLRTHMRKHTGERPFPCPAEGCDYAASRSGHLTRHMKVHQRGGRGRGRGRPSKKALAAEAEERARMEQEELMLLQQQQQQQQQQGAAAAQPHPPAVSPPLGQEQLPARTEPAVAVPAATLSTVVGAAGSSFAQQAALVAYDRTTSDL